MPRRKTDAEWACKLAGLDIKLGQLAARREQMQARWQVEQRKRETRAKRVLGDALLRHDLASPEAPVTLPALIETYVATGRDRDVVAAVLQAAQTQITCRIAPSSGALPQTANLRLAAIGGSAAAVVALRKRHEQARIIIGGAVLRWARRSPEAPQSLRSLIACDVTRQGDLDALAEAFQWNTDIH